MRAYCDSTTLESAEIVIRYPMCLIPTSTEPFKLHDGRIVGIPKATPSFSRWTGEAPGDSYGGKAILEHDGRPMFAELAILALLESEGWEGVWIDTYRNKYRRGYWDADPIAALPARQAAMMQRILDHRGAGRSGTWDIFAWRGEDVLFAESKRAGKDSIRASQVTWLASALAQGHSLTAFLVVEWSLL